MVFLLDSEKEDYVQLLLSAAEKSSGCGFSIADNAPSDEDMLGADPLAAQADVKLLSVTVSLDRGPELTTVLDHP